MSTMLLSPMSPIKMADFDGHDAMMKPSQESAIRIKMTDEESSDDWETRTIPQIQSEDEGDSSVPMEMEEPPKASRIDKEESKPEDKTATEDNESFAAGISFTRPDSFGGLKNLGNTCYLNSALQMLAGLDDFLNSLVDTPHSQVKPQTKESEEKLALRKSFLDLMQSLRQDGIVNPAEFKKVIDSRSSLFIGYRQQDSHEFLTTLLDMLNEDYQTKDEDGKVDGSSEESPTETGIGTDPASASDSTMSKDGKDDHDCVPAASPRRVKSFKDLQVEDISELLHGASNDQAPKAATMGNSDTTMEPLCKLVGGQAMPTVDPAALQLPGAEALTPEITKTELPDESKRPAGPKSPVDEYFATDIRTQLTCDSCKYTRSRVEKFFHLSLDVGSEKGSLDDGVRKFFAPEKLSLKCEKCFCETATQTKEIVKLPNALLFHFKRFIVDVSPDYSSISYRKNQSPIDFEKSIPIGADNDTGLAEYFASDVAIPQGMRSYQRENGTEDRSFSLRSVVNHIGSSASCGHYTANSFRFCKNRGGEWSRFNDSIVTRTSAEEVLGQSTKGTAYMVLYELE